MSINSGTLVSDTASALESYRNEDWEEVNHFLSRNPYLTGELAEIPERILSGFPMNTTLHLVLSTDYESGTDTLFIEVDNELTLAENLDIIRDIEMDWWGDLDIGFRRLVSLDTK
jgi:hypothetical protein